MTSVAGLYEKSAKIEATEALLLDGFDEIPASKKAERDSKRRLALALESLCGAWDRPEKKAEWHNRAALLKRRGRKATRYND